MYCRICGNLLGESDNFCKNCGTKRLEITPNKITEVEIEENYIEEPIEDEIINSDNNILSMAIVFSVVGIALAAILIISSFTKGII